MGHDNNKSPAYPSHTTNSITINKSVREEISSNRRKKKSFMFFAPFFLIIHTQFKRYLSDLYPSPPFHHCCIFFLVKYSVLASHAIFISSSLTCIKILLTEKLDDCLRQIYIYLKRSKKGLALILFLGMGLCWGSLSDSTPRTTPTSTGNISSGTLKSSNNTTTTGTSRGSNISSNSGFSVASGEDACPEGQILPIPNLRIFSLAELRASTRNFKSENVLGEGGFGKVFKGWLEDKTPGKPSNGTVIAVKKLNAESFQGFEEWQCEVNFLGRVSHPNLVKLLGYCLEGEDLLLVYEYMQKGSLENHLFRKGSAVQPLSWEIRLRIAIGAAKGLEFLHASEKQVIYRDFKASNILLDGSYNAKISDFGLAKLGPSASQSHITTRVMGTHGYAAPEYVATGHLYVKSDVYGFGVVLAEILTGLHALDPTRPTGQHNLTEWIKPHLSERRKLRSIMDPRLEGKYPFKSAFRVAQLALKCLGPEPKDRPSMKEVVESLELIESANEKPLERRTTRASQSVRQQKGHYRPHQLSSFRPRQTVARAH